MPATVLFLNMAEEDPTKRLKLAGARRYAAAAGWNLVPVESGRSIRKDIPELLAGYRPVGCICDEDATPTRFSPGLFGGIPVIFANAYGGGHRAVTRIGVDNAAVAAAAFRELSANVPAACAVVGYPIPRKWSSIRIRKFVSLAAEAKLACRVFPMRRNENLAAFSARLRPWVAALPRHTAIYAVNDIIARRIADAASAKGLRIPQDLTLLGTDNNAETCEMPGRVSISSLQLDFERMGYLAAKMLGETMARHGKNETSRTTGTDRAPRSAQLSRGSPSTVATIGPLLAVRRESTGGSGRREPHVMEAVKIIRREACAGLTVAGLAKRLPGSRRLLDLRFREAMGHSAFDEILQIRLERVFDMLRQPGTPISAVADFSGFGTLRGLDKLFRARFGCSLRAWRKRNVQP